MYFNLIRDVTSVVHTVPRPVATPPITVIGNSIGTLDLSASDRLSSESTTARLPNSALVLQPNKRREFGATSRFVLWFPRNVANSGLLSRSRLGFSVAENENMMTTYNELSRRDVTSTIDLQLLTQEMDLPF